MRILGLDLGDRRIGVAVGDTDTGMAFPLKVIEINEKSDTIKQIKACLDEEKASLVVVGYPLNMDGSAGSRARTSDEFAGILGAECGCEVRLWDERLTSVLGERVLIEADISRRKRRKVVDKLAAQIMLQGYLDRHYQRSEDRSQRPEDRGI